jgi:hypothetical protein
VYVVKPRASTRLRQLLRYLLRSGRSISISLGLRLLALCRLTRTLPSSRQSTPLETVQMSSSAQPEPVSMQQANLIPEWMSAEDLSRIFLLVQEPYRPEPFPESAHRLLPEEWKRLLLAYQVLLAAQQRESLH